MRLIGRWLRVQRLTEPDRIRRAQLIMVGGMATFVYLLAVSLEGMVDRNGPLTAVPAAVAVLAGGAVIAARRGRLAAGETMTAVVILVATIAVIALQGVVSVRLSIIYVCTMFLGLALRRWMVPVHVLVSVALLIAAVLIERAGLPFPLAPSRQPAWMGVVRQILLATAIITAYSHGYRRLLGDLARHTAQLDEAHRDLLSARERMEELVAKRSGEIERANASMESFSAAAAHDLRAPLRHIQGFLDLFATDPATISDLGSARLAPIIEARDMAQALTAKVEAILARDGRARADETSGATTTARSG